MEKSGSGRVAIFQATGLPNCYTLECNYHSGRVVNATPLPSGVSAYGMAQRYAPTFSPHYCNRIYGGVGCALLLAILDIEGLNPVSRIDGSQVRCALL